MSFHEALKTARFAVRVVVAWSQSVWFKEGVVNVGRRVFYELAADPSDSFACSPAARKLTLIVANVIDAEPEDGDGCHGGLSSCEDGTMMPDGPEWRTP